MKKLLIGMAAIAVAATSAAAQYGPGPQPQQGGGYGNGGNGGGGGYGGGGGMWRGAPQGAHERIQFLQDRINRGMSDGSLNRREAGGALHELDRIRSMDRSLHYRDHGRLTPGDEAAVQHRLDDLSSRIHWERHNGM